MRASSAMLVRGIKRLLLTPMPLPATIQVPAQPEGAPPPDSDLLIAQAYATFRVTSPPPTLAAIAARVDPARLAGDVGSSLRNVESGLRSAATC